MARPVLQMQKQRLQKVSSLFCTPSMAGGLREHTVQTPKARSQLDACPSATLGTSVCGGADHQAG